MKHCIQKERLQLMSPSANVCAAATLSGRPDALALQAAVQNAVERHAILHSRVVIEADGNAYLTEDGIKQAPTPVVSAFAGGVETLITAQDQIPFAIDEGEMVRVFFNEESAALVVIAHHLVCDGESVILLMRDILLCLNGQEIAAQPIRLFRREDLPKHPGLGFMMRLMMRLTNARWARQGKAFSFDDYRRMFWSYAASHRTTLLFHTVPEAQMNRLTQLAHERHITINSLLAAALAARLPAGEGIGIPVGVRPPERTDLGNFAIAVSVKAAYDETKELTANAEDMHRLIAAKLNQPRERYFLNDFMGALRPTLTDSIYFSAYDGYPNPVAKSARDMCGYTENPKGVTLSNLKTLHMPENPAWRYRYRSLRFIPPYIPNVRSVIGASTYQGQLTLAFRSPTNGREAEERERFERVCAALEAL